MIVIFAEIAQVQFEHNVMKKKMVKKKQTCVYLFPHRFLLLSQEDVLGGGTLEKKQRIVMNTNGTWKALSGLIQLNGAVSICDVEKYKKIYQEIAQLDPEDTLQLILEADTEEQREFYQVVGDFLLQKKQKEVIERNLF